MYDGRTARWMTIDPKKQYASPYLAMGNNPILRIDPDGGSDGPGFFSRLLDRIRFGAQFAAEKFAQTVRGDVKLSESGKYSVDWVDEDGTITSTNFDRARDGGSIFASMFMQRQSDPFVGLQNPVTWAVDKVKPDILLFTIGAAIAVPGNPPVPTAVSVTAAYNTRRNEWAYYYNWDERFGVDLSAGVSHTYMNFTDPGMAYSADWSNQLTGKYFGQAISVSILDLEHVSALDSKYNTFASGITFGISFSPLPVGGSIYEGNTTKIK